MRTLVKNKQKMYYSNLLGTAPKYKLDDDGNKIVDWVDESTDPPTTYYVEDGGEKYLYSNPKEFYGNIAMSGGDVNRVEYGVNESNYEAILTVKKGTLPITETSLLWFRTEPKYIDGDVDDSTADYKVLKVSPSLNVDRYILEKVVK